ncbi:uncharacterized protein APUU_10646S [Aspergillus puulaauensis]|uniref:Ankyrin repeat-containing domain protein n=1 Tax=Aspergillus puulaauensis TaxID=1220207 RepID=A0A7R7XAN2_9EURO|nr:uncharacterized protein APUU_10646S [Aspergillus puulaauensis]BCS17818.1 hypothetical protein APUU_10646S [Aspergillus puulaauensis]
MDVSAGIADINFIIDVIKTLIDAAPKATRNFHDLKSECMLLGANLDACKKRFAGAQLDGWQRGNVDMVLGRCLKTLENLKRLLESGRSVKSGSPSIAAMVNFSNTKIAEWKDKVRSARADLTFIFCMDTSFSNASIADEVCLMRSEMTRIGTQIRGSSNVSLHTSHSCSTISQNHWRDIRSALREKGVTGQVLKTYKEQIILGVQRLISIDGETPPTTEAIVTSPSTIGVTLVGAAGRDDWDPVEGLIRDSININIHDGSVQTTCSLAISRKQWTIVEALVGRGLSPDSKSVDQQPAIGVAAESQAWSTVDFLVLKGASFKVRINGDNTAISPPHRESAEGRHPAASARITTPPRVVTLQVYDKQYGPRAKQRSSGDPIIVAAAAAQSWTTVSLLTEHGANVNAKDSLGRSAFYYVLIAMRPHLHLLEDMQGLHADGNRHRGPSQEALDVDRVAILLLEKGAAAGQPEFEAISGGTAGDKLRRRVLNWNNMPRGSRSLLNRPDGWQGVYIGFSLLYNYRVIVLCLLLLWLAWSPSTRLTD